MNSILLDTGPLIAILDKRDKAHKQCVYFLKGFRGHLLITEPVLTESAYLLRSAKYFKTCISLVSAGQIHIFPFNHKRLLRCVELMEKYENIPMDLADASLVALAEEKKINDIFTLDSDFTIYRMYGRSPFHVLPD